MPCEENIRSELQGLGAELVRFVDISKLPAGRNKGFPNAVLFGLVLSARYVREVGAEPDYVRRRIADNYNFADDELQLKERRTDELADHLAAYLAARGYKAYSQSDGNQAATGFFDGKRGETPLPHKTIASLAGMGWIGKNNLLVTPEFGSAVCLGTVLTDAPLKTVLHETLPSRCGDCRVCADICAVKSLKGRAWSVHSTREEMLDASKCNTCMKCLVLCPWTQAYVKNKL